MPLRQTHTFAVLEVSAAAYEEIRGKLLAAGYDQAVFESGDRGIIVDMHGIALAPEGAKAVSVVVNGRRRFMGASVTHIGYEDVVALAGLADGSFPSVTLKSPGEARVLRPGQKVSAVEGMAFSAACHTGSA